MTALPVPVPVPVPVPARRAVLRTIRPAPCRSSRRPSAARNTGPPVRDAEDLEAAAALRDKEAQLRASKLRLEQQWAAGADVQAVVAENQRVHRELDRMRGLLREHGIEPDDGTAQTA
ncbi:MAG TPA: hypothetical protein VF070_08205 [Streptosporangiaceae bacterium]